MPLGGFGWEGIGLLTCMQEQAMNDKRWANNIGDRQIQKVVKAFASFSSPHLPLLLTSTEYGNRTSKFAAYVQCRIRNVYQVELETNTLTNRREKNLHMPRQPFGFVCHQLASGICLVSALIAQWNHKLFNYSSILVELPALCWNRCMI